MLVQELTTHLFYSLKQFDPEKSDRKSFSTTVVERQVAKLIRFQSAAKRNSRNVQSLNVKVEMDSQTVDMVETLSNREYDARRCTSTRDPVQQLEMSHDMEAVLARLPFDLLELAVQLKQKSLTQIAKETNVPRSTLRKRVAELREIFESENLRLYL